MRSAALSVLSALSLAGLGCGEGGDLAVSAGAPVVAAVQGTITDCGTPVSRAEVTLLVDQAEPGQALPVHTEIGPVPTDTHGTYSLEVSPAFAVPGPAMARLRVAPPGGAMHEFPSQTLQFSLGQAQDTLRFDADLGITAGSCR
jgi:hypothetical protein